jgi:predicted O-methyltransferase YrrM
MSAPRTPWRRALTAGYGLARRVGDRLGVHVVRKHYTSPIPDLEELPHDLWERRSALGGVPVDAEAQFAFLEQRLAGFLAEFDPPLHPTGERGRYYARNDAYPGVDAQVLYAMVRHLKPARVLELGSGYSSMVVAEAAERNAAEGSALTHTLVDPYPSSDLTPEFLRRRELMPVRVQDVALERFGALEAGDVLLVDTSHTVKIGGDVNFVVLDVLPLLRQGVFVHFHDVFLPWEYPRAWIEERQWYWAEQYLLQAFLAFNSAYHVVIGTHLLARTQPERLTRLASAHRHARSPYEHAALWIRRATS